MDVKRLALGSYLAGLTALMLSFFVVAEAAAQIPNLSNVVLCNGKDRPSPEPQIAGCSALIKSDISNPKVLAIAHNNRGNAYTGRGDYDLAIADYDESIKLDPAYAKPLNNRGVAFQKKGDYDRAIEDFNRAIPYQPSYVQLAYGNRANAYAMKGDTDRAIDSYSVALSLDKNYSAAYTGRGLLYEKNGEIDKARDDYNAALNAKSTFQDEKWAKDTARDHLDKLKDK